MAKPKIPLADRFWNKVDKNGPIVRPELGPCWQWCACRNRGGYGVFKNKCANKSLAHQVSWLLHNGAISDGLCVLHKCDNRTCVRPDHLFLGTKADNNHDAFEKGRCNGGNRVLTPDQVRDIRNRCDAKTATQIALAREYGVVKSVISEIVSRKLWAHVN